ncbi:hypothetical protein GCM10027570_37300 [Streptomonospora sediminis]
MYGPQSPQAPQPPQAQYGAPQKKTNGWLWGCLGCGGLVVLLFMVVGCMAALSSGDPDTTSGTDAPAAPSGDEGSDGSGPGGDADGSGGSGGDGGGGGQEKADVAGIGDTVESGAFAFTVTEVETGVTQVGDNPYLTEQAQGQYVIVHVTVENIGDQAGTFESSSQKLFDADGNEYSTDTGAELAMDAESFLNEINPGNKVQGKLVYDVPADVEPTRIELQDWLSLDPPAEVKLS